MPPYVGLQLPAGIERRRRGDARLYKENLMKRALGMALLAMGMTATGLASAQSGPRPGDVEYTLGPAQHFSDSFQGEGGSSLDLSSRTGVRMGV